MLGILGGCALFEGNPTESPGVAPDSPADASSISLAERNEGYALLYGLVGDESGVDKILIIKVETDAVEAVITSIADKTGEMRKRLDAFAESDPGLDFEYSHLPVMELRTRESISAAKARELLLPGGNDMLELVLTQVRALEYGQHLAEELADVEPSEERKEFLEEASATFAELLEKTVALLMLAQ